VLAALLISFAMTLVTGLTTLLLLMMMIFLSNPNSSTAISALCPTTTTTSSSSSAAHCHLSLQQPSSSSTQRHAQAVSGCLRQCSSKGVVVTRASAASSTSLGWRAWPSLAHASQLLLLIKPLALRCHTLCCQMPLLCCRSRLLSC
jgi:hypothetical protein